ncbi:MAG: peptide chain release factor N(5)-glutamine methyltransferase [Xanthomonadales bacterium]|nr:peptide chain release factor N(5)-glutamine methyltransferase [Xanthomonadales bacterium]
MSADTTLAACVREAVARLRAMTDAEAAECRYEVELLLGHVLGRDRAWLFAHAGDQLDAGPRERFEALLVRRIAGEPVAHIVGCRGFWTLDLQVNSDTLIPRPETETLVEQVLARLVAEQCCDVADLGTGSGAIALALASERPTWRLHAVDASEAALAVARSNQEALRLQNVTLHHGDWLQPLHGRRFDAIVSNPPYIEDDDPHLSRGDLRFEPRMALASGADGLDAIRRIVADSPACLKPRGWLLLEHGWRQGEAVRALLDASGFVEVTTVTDLEGRERVSLGRWPG